MGITRGTDASNARNVAQGALRSVIRELGDVVRLLDAMNRPRFADQPGLLLAWTRAKNIVGGGAGPAAPAPPAEQTPPAGPPAMSAWRPRRGIGRESS